MHETQDELTNQKLTRFFSNNFTLTLLAIDRAKEYIRSQIPFTLDSLLDSIAESEEAKHAEEG